VVLTGFLHMLASGNPRGPGSVVPSGPPLPRGVTGQALKSNNPF
jgi:hypothetical protein